MPTTTTTAEPTTAAPTKDPTGAPTTTTTTPEPTTAEPTATPTKNPTGNPTVPPTKAPTGEPTTPGPTTSPTDQPTTTTTVTTTTTTEEPTTAEPTPTPTKAPTEFDVTGDLIADNWTPFGECFYKKVESELSWDKARSYCYFDAYTGDYPELHVNGWLAAPETVDEAHFIATMRDAGKPVWTSGVREANGMWGFDPKDNKAVTSSSGAAVFYPYGGPDRKPPMYSFNIAELGLWYPGEPAEPTDQRACMLQGIGRRKADKTMEKMNDVQCDKSFRAICQWCPPESWPTTTTTAEPTTTTTCVSLLVNRRFCVLPTVVKKC